MAKSNIKNVVVDDITDYKELRKLFRTKTNVLVLFLPSIKGYQDTIRTFREAADVVKGLGTMVLLDCSASDVKKICKKVKVIPEPYSLKHYKDGEFHKDYDRKISVSSLVNFMRDPTGDLPWEEDSTATDVVHIADTQSLTKFLKKELKPTLLMFYAPWCGFCKTLKPEYSAAAAELKPKHVLAAIDVNRPENSMVRKIYNITGFPTLLYFEKGKMKFTFNGENSKDGIIKFMGNPTEPVVTPKKEEPDWASDSSSEIVHLSDSSFEPALKDEKSALVMFYAPWCGHCKRLKPEYETAAELMKEKNVPGILAAVDSTKETEISAKFGIKGYPTLKYFSNGEFQYDVNLRDGDKIIQFMEKPTTPPPPPPPEASWEDEPSHVVHLHDETFKSFLKKKKHVLVMFYAPWCGHCKSTKPEFVKTAEHFKDDLKIELAAVDCTQHQALCSSQDVKGYPTIKYFNYFKDSQAYEGGRTEKDFISFFKDPTATTTETNNAAEKLEPFGDYPGSEDIIILSDDDFDAKLKNLPKTLVMFYSKGCGHCTEMKPAYSRAAKIIGDSGVGKLAALDGMVNKKLLKRFNIAGFPTLKYFEYGILKHEYQGARTTENLVSFMSTPVKDEF